VTDISEAAAQKLANHRWPGNVRELENVITRAMALSESSQLLPEHIQFPGSAAISTQLDEALPTTLAEAERLHIRRILTSNHWNITHTAQDLDISPTTLRKKINDYDLKNSGSYL
jgi:DNA-binding NtrC family response regulator